MTDRPSATGPRVGQPETGTAVVLVTHHLGVVAVADRVLERIAGASAITKEEER